MAIQILKESETPVRFFECPECSSEMVFGYEDQVYKDVIGIECPVCGIFTETNAPQFGRWIQIV